MEKFMTFQPMKGKTIEQLRTERESFVKKLEEEGHTIDDSATEEMLVFTPGVQLEGYILEHSDAEKNLE